MSYRRMIGALLALFMAGCGGVYDEVSPGEKGRVEARLSPEVLRVGDEFVAVGAFLNIAPERAYVSAIDLGEGVRVDYYDSDYSKGCEGLPVPEEFEGRLRLCMAVKVEEGAPLGARQARFEVSVWNEPVVAEVEFYVLRRLE